MRLRPLGNLLLVSAVLCIGTGTALGSNFSFAGNFGQDDQLQIFQFVTASTTGVVLRTWSYAGGTNSAGGSVLAGGFDPILSIFGPDMTLLSSTPLVQQNNDGSGVDADPVTGSSFDSLLDTSINPLPFVGTYYLVLTQADNSPNGPTYGDGFHETGNPTFTSIFGCSNGQFCDVTTDNRNGHWAVDILNVDSAQDISGPQVPEPGTVLLFSAAMAGMLMIRRRASGNSRKSS